MKKCTCLLAAGLLLLSLTACAAKPEEPAPTTTATTVATAAETNDIGEEPGEAELYEAFIESRQWTFMEDGAGDLSEWDFELTARKMFDFDGDGVDELWIEASEPGGFDKFSGFYCIEDAQVKELLTGYITGGTIGGDEVAMYYDTQTKQHLAGLSGYAGGFGGNASYGTYYECENGQLREVLSLEMESMFDSEPVYTVSGKQVTEEEYELAQARMIEPTDKKFLLEDTP